MGNVIVTIRDIDEAVYRLAMADAKSRPKGHPEKKIGVWLSNAAKLKLNFQKTQELIRKQDAKEKRQPDKRTIVHVES